jgi:hypothetical protein
MTKDRIAGTDAGSFALCDAGFAPRVEKINRRALKPHVTAGDVLLYSAGGDCEIRVRLLLDEEMPAAFQPKVREQQRDLLLKLPTGRLFLCGLEDLGKNAEGCLSNSAAPTYTADLPPGDYLVAASELDWGEEPDELAASEEKQIIGSRVSRGRQGFTQFMGWFAVAFLFGSPVALFVGYLAGGWMTCAKVFGVIVVLYLLFVGIAWLLAKHPSEKAYGDALKRREEILSRFPDLVVQFKRLPVGADVSMLKGGEVGRSR